MKKVKRNKLKYKKKMFQLTNREPRVDPKGYN
jgi:hypothetical protein